MAISTFRLRTGALAAAAGLVLAGFAVASPAAAEEVPAPVIELDQTSFPAGDWQDGFTVTGSGFDPSAPTAIVSVGSRGENGGGQLFEVDVPVEADGTIDALVVPTDAPTQVPDEAGWPKYSVSVGQEVAAGQPWLWSNRIDLTITEGASITAAAEASPEELAAGVTAQFAGFAPGESIAFTVELSRWTEEDGTQLIDELQGTVTADANGAGSISAALTGAAVEDWASFSVTGEESARTARATTRVVEAQAPIVPAPAAPAPAAAGPQLAETGVELGIGFAALALMVLGAGAIVVTRRVRGAQR
ncbi:hypothetical protein [Agromyces laixinhei]|uniref:hypothetical protein n=1 Tax=Agromyces laixinhei TaxID=2585717 RepID=UPI0012EDB4F3|nr:hypothetical protein [Agromyces laixinhei]